MVDTSNLTIGLSVFVDVNEYPLFLVIGHYPPSIHRSKHSVSEDWHDPLSIFQLETLLEQIKFLLNCFIEMNSFSFTDEHPYSLPNG